MQHKLVVGNWKMNGTGAALSALSDLARAHPNAKADIVICPPATLIQRATETARDSAIEIGAQDCHAEISGAHTGDISAEMLRDAGARYVITGHSERRQNHGESDMNVRAKTRAATAADLTAILCVGESQTQRKAGQTLDIIDKQLKRSIPDEISAQTLVVAYEPIWAIGTGLVPSLDQINEVHTFIRAQLQTRFGSATGQQIRLLYGGSVKPTNAADIFKITEVNGALVGGASLNPNDFSPIIKALEASPSFFSS